MALLTRLPPEVLQQILLCVHDGFERHRFSGFYPPLGRHELKGINHRRRLCALRRVNRKLCELVTPLLFQHIVITSSSGVLRLQQLSRDPRLRRLVRRLEICVEVRPVNLFSVYEMELKKNKKKNLRYLARLAVVIHTTLPRFSNVKILKLDFDDIPYDTNRDIDMWPAECYYVQDTANLFESLATALHRSRLDMLDEVDLSLPLAYDFRYFLDDEQGDTDGYTASALFQRLKYLSLHYGHSTDDGEGIEFRHQQPNLEYDRYIRELLPLARNIHTLKLKGSDVMVLDQSAVSHLRLRSLSLESMSITGEALVSVFQKSLTLEEAILRGVYLESGNWKDILTAMNQPQIISFRIQTCGYQMEGLSAHLRPENPGEDPDHLYIETNEASDLDACRALFSRVRENKRRIYGSDYDEAADLDRERTERELIEQKSELVRELAKNWAANEAFEGLFTFAFDEASSSEEEWPSSE
ncbi:hypothetical protein FALBO_2479 [Fusarium albosuccineum]|uniref:Uncharacterized protein n=1 Tax=Fusarium albosuccineum TaxID=1237068 RepID=A0A8H4PGT6_9HYPO|nr:hypothetical protein FALBO_2479 [Fusarium albosuccineum]